MKSLHTHVGTGFYDDIILSVGLAVMFGSLLIGDIFFMQPLMGFMIGFIAFLAIIAAYGRFIKEDSQND